MPSRRAVIAGAAGLAAGGVVVADRVPIGALDPWEPDRDTWPLHRHDPANTAYASGAFVPEDAAVDWTADVGTDVVEPGRLLADRERVYAAASSLTALRRDDGRVAWDAPDPTARLALRGGRLFATTPPTYEGSDLSAPGELVAREATTGSVAWRRDLPGEPGGLTVVNGAAMVARSTATVAHETGTGLLRWRAPDIACRSAPLVHDGALFLDDAGLTRFGPRDALSVPLRGPPDRVWSRPFGRDLPPVGLGSRVIVGAARGSATGVESPALAGFDATNGTREWMAVPPEDAGVVQAGPLTADASRGLVYVPVYRQWGATAEDGEHEAAVVAVGAADGKPLWRQPVSGFAATVVRAAHGTVLVGTGPVERSRRPAGAVCALAADDGRERWRVEVGAGVRALVPVEGTVFALTRAGSVVAIR
jgi:outer membrane protein assembly factor BamB